MDIDPVGTKWLASLKLSRIESRILISASHKSFREGGMYQKHLWFSVQ